MNALIVEDDFVSRILLQELLKKMGTADSVSNGKEAISKCIKAIENENVYDLICLDIMMPEMDGKVALKKIRELEDNARLSFSKRSKIIMTTALGDVENVMDAFYQLCDGYIVKPFTQKQLNEELKRLCLIE